ncbi:HAD family hydrolase [Candidatus Bathyarchaeota archaeon]|nr:HAD family hydrolase [Candidatus Bathyarchaeota archaeon]
MASNRLEGVVFDLDATLVDLGGHVEWKKAHEDIERLYIDHGCGEEDVRACSSKGLFPMLDDMWEINHDNRGGVEADKIQDSVYRVLSMYEEKGSQRCGLMPGCLNALNWVSYNGLLMGVCTSNSFEAAMMSLKLQRLDRYFKAVVGRSTAYRMKPHPDQLLACLDTMGVDPGRGVMVGDSHSDVLAGKAAGSYTVAIPVYFSRLEKIKEAGSDRIIESLAELPEALRGI